MKSRYHREGGAKCKTKVQNYGYKLSKKNES